MDPKETATYHAVLIAAAVIGSVITFFIISVIRQQRKHRLLYKAKLEAEIITLEKERARIAADLHDELGPTLSAAKFKLGSITAAAGNDEKLINDAITYIDSILQQVRNIAYGLMPNTLVRKGLLPAIDEFITHMKAISSLSISIRHNNLPPLGADFSVHIYRIIQEIIHNTVKHANASTLLISITFQNGLLLVSAADNGNGFSLTGNNDHNSGVGLNNLRSRTEILGGELHIRSGKTKGTSLSIEIPFKQPHNPAQ